MLSALITNDLSVKKLNVHGQTLAVRQLADDITLLILLSFQNKDQIPLAIFLVISSCTASGLQQI